MKTRLVVLLACVLFVSVHPAFAQSRDPYFTTFSANYDVVSREPGATSNAGAHFDVAGTWKRDEPFIGPVGEVGFRPLYHNQSWTIVLRQRTWPKPSRFWTSARNAGQKGRLAGKQPSSPGVISGIAATRSSRDYQRAA